MEATIVVIERDLMVDVILVITWWVNAMITRGDERARRHAEPLANAAEPSSDLHGARSRSIGSTKDHDLSFVSREATRRPRRTGGARHTSLFILGVTRHRDGARQDNGHTHERRLSWRALALARDSGDGLLEAAQGISEVAHRGSRV